jgi:hypothetical protein
MRNGRINVNKLQQRGKSKVGGQTKAIHRFDGSDETSTTQKSIKLTTVGSSVVGYVQRGQAQVAYSMVPKQQRTGSLEDLLGKTGFPQATGRANREVK